MTPLTWARITRWHRSCPCTGGLLVTAGGVELVGVVLTAPGFLALAGASAVASWLLGALLIVAGLTVLFDPRLRYFAGTTAIVCGLLSLALSNLGGYLLGCLLAVLGGSLTLAWTPHPTTEPRRP